MHAFATLALLLSLAVSTAHASGSDATTPLDLKALLAERARGYVHLMLENRVVRQARLSYDGENLRLVLAGLETVLLDPDAAKVSVIKHPRGNFYVTQYEWDPPGYPHIVRLLARPAAVRELENEVLYAGAKRELPALIVSFQNRNVDFVEIQGGLWAHDQDDGDLAQMLEDLNTAGGEYVSFVKSDAELCALELKRLRIKVWR